MISRRRSLALCATSLPTLASRCSDVDIKSLQPWSAGVDGIPYMVGVAEELLRLATFTTELDIKAVIADRATYCFEVVCEHVQKDLRSTENEFTLGSRKLRHGQPVRNYRGTSSTNF